MGRQTEGDFQIVAREREVMDLACLEHIVTGFRVGKAPQHGLNRCPVGVSFSHCGGSLSNAMRGGARRPEPPDLDFEMASRGFRRPTGLQQQGNLRAGGAITSYLFSRR